MDEGMMDASFPRFNNEVLVLVLALLSACPYDGVGQPPERRDSERVAQVRTTVTFARSCPKVQYINLIDV
jgi:hypothetical protein